MKKIDTILHDGLIKNGVLGQEQLDAAVQEAEKSQESLFTVIMRGNLITEQSLLQLLAKELSMPFADLYHVTIDKSVSSRVPQKVAKYYKFLPVALSDRGLTVGVCYPLELTVLDEVRVQLGLEIEQLLMTSTDLAEGMRICYGAPSETIGNIASQVFKDGRQEEVHEKVEDIARLAGDASIIKLVNQIIIDAYQKRATDIHIEPYRQDVSIRYRVDGILYDSPLLPEMKGLINAIISRIKIMSNLNIVERRLPQDGRAVVKVADQVLDLRISTIPTQFGESVVIRVLPTLMLFDLAKLGLSKKDQALFDLFIQKPHGIIFVTGPTGSGKTTTLYACLTKINKRDRKIITIEDPIEYEMPGVTQIQVQPEIGLDFARGLRSILRHDPDVIMVGEVRDLETAEIAIRVALTGHLVFSTLHTNDAASGITRLMDIGLEPYLVASSVEAFVAQRLIRMICPQCKYEDQEASKELKRMIAHSIGVTFEEARIFRGKGCTHCGGTGYFGRSAIYEIIQVDDAIKELILQKASAGQIKKAALQRGMRTLAQDGWHKTVAGLTTPEEIIRVTEAGELNQEESSGVPQGRPSSGGSSQERPSQDDSVDPWAAKRAFKRVDNSVGIRYRVYRQGEDLTHRGQRPDKISVTKDISAGGLLFVSDEILTTGQILELYIDLPRSRETVDCLARVVKVADMGNRFDVSVCFLDLTGAQRARLDEYVNAESEEKN
jgi:type II secretory ATPase GspE/PulE/Tfp pilus assembly ATPase PilB-like protein